MLNNSFEPPLDNVEKIESVMTKAFAEFLKKGYNKGEFQELFDLVYEQIENNLDKYDPKLNY